MEPVEIVARVREKYPTPLGAEHGKCLLEIASALGNGAGLYKKDYGTFVVLPDGTKVSQDIICYPDGRGYDCLIGGEAEAKPGWGGPYELDKTRYYAVGAPPPPDTGDFVSKADFEAYKTGIASVLSAATLNIRALQQDVAAQTAVLAAAKADIASLQAELAKPLTVEGNTASAGPSFLRHYHGSTGLTIKRG